MARYTIQATRARRHPSGEESIQSLPTFTIEALNEDNAEYIARFIILPAAQAEWLAHVTATLDESGTT